MNRKLASAAVAALAAVGLVTLGALGPTGADPIASTDVPDNHVGIGALQLDLSGGGATTALSFSGMLPGGRSSQLFWVARNDDASSLPGTLAIAFDHLVDAPAPCNVSLDKAAAEIASGVPGCTVSGSTITGTPAQGNLSRKLSVDMRYLSAADASHCATGTGTSLLPSAGEPGNLRSAVNGSATTLRDTHDVPVLLAPGQGMCVEAIASWPEVASAESAPDRDHPSDNAAQGDSFAVRVRFTLSQVGP